MAPSLPKGPVSSSLISDHFAVEEWNPGTKEIVVDVANQEVRTSAILMPARFPQMDFFRPGV